jgi:drug/metabolite transporter, DME family
MAAMAAGMALFFIGQEPASATAPEPARGNLLGAAAGQSWALTVIGLRWLGRRGGDAAVAVVAGNWTAFLVCLPMALPLTAGRPADWGLVAYLGVFQIAIAYILLTRAVESMGAFEMALLLLVEPVLNPLWAWWIHGEVPGRWSLSGGAVVLLVTALKTWLDAAGASRRAIS